METFQWQDDERKATLDVMPARGVNKGPHVVGIHLSPSTYDAVRVRRHELKRRISCLKGTISSEDDTTASRYQEDMENMHESGRAEVALSSLRPVSERRYRSAALR